MQDQEVVVGILGKKNAVRKNSESNGDIGFSARFGDLKGERSLVQCVGTGG